MDKHKKLVVGILAHVDAGKTTLAESILYTCGHIRSLGRVDHGDAFLDNYALERARGITIFSKQAQVSYEQIDITLLDTPGHVDFSTEMERTLQVLDYAILVISGADGVQGHVKTLWKLLKHYQIPVFLFVNKMDQDGTNQLSLMEELQEELDEKCLNFGVEAKDKEEFFDALSMCDEELMEEYLESGNICQESIPDAVWERKIFPCFFGSALKITGVTEFLQGIQRYTIQSEYPEQFGARVYKIGRDTAGNRLTYLKVTGGILKAKMPVDNVKSAGIGEEAWQEKADQLRIYDGARYTTVDEVSAGGVCAVTGLTRTFAGQGLGEESENELSQLEPVLTYQILLPDDVDAITALGKLRQLEEEDPMLHLVWKEESKEIHVQVMGEVQIEILKSLIAERFGMEVSFGTGSIVYKETIAEPVVGIGHFEPLRHYAEVHLLLEPGERGSGLQFASLCSEDMLDRNWQRLVMTHLEEREHPGVLTGSAITDMRILLIAGRAHQKHTEGGDFRQACYRAVRNGLRKGKSVLLEPVFSFTLELPVENLGRAMSDIQRMYGKFDTPVTKENTAVLTGTAPVATMRDYQREVASYTRGLGRFSCVVSGYEPCHNPEEVITAVAYAPEADVSNPTGSVFCAHGAGFLVDWDRVEEYAHVENNWRPDGQEDEEITEGFSAQTLKAMSRQGRENASASNYITQEEIEEIFRQSYGAKEKDNNRYRRYHRTSVRSEGGRLSSDVKPYRATEPVKKKEYLLVDGYNIIFAWEELRSLAARNIDSARDKLMDICSNYQGYQGCTLILVFDAYKVKGNPGSVQKYHNIYVVYTKEAETADQYIEKTVHDIGKTYHVTVATSDALEQMIIWGGGAMRMSASGFKTAVEDAEKNLREQFNITEG
ncbi:MAG: TetM/TetW/TetO/TetS family tetracycline resistance ribosomal protection protein [Acetatifactor sp.]|nr:TetM/TetW/TetO/TetS family tetracycline resistance ribosomal protection protein [Acetatifactor sp.]